MIEVRTKKREEIIDITEDVRKIVKERSGLALIYTPHPPTAITVNEAESGLLEDIISKMREIIPRGAGYKHDRIDDNADAHIKASIIGNSAIVPVENGRLLLGTWQRILFLEFDGPRNRRVIVEVYETKKD